MAGEMAGEMAEVLVNEVETIETPDGIFTGINGRKIHAAKGSEKPFVVWLPREIKRCKLKREEDFVIYESRSSRRRRTMECLFFTKAAAKILEKEPPHGMTEEDEDEDIPSREEMGRLLPAPVSGGEQVFDLHDTPCIDARTLYETLKIKKSFSIWIRSNFKKINLEKGRDYREIEVLDLKVQNFVGRPRTDYLLSLDAAKHIAMMSKGRVAHTVRQYFIDIEKRYRIESALPAPGSPNDPRRLGQDLINDIRTRLKSLGKYCCPDYAESLSDFVERSLLYHFDIRSIYQLRQGDVPMFKYQISECQRCFEVNQYDPSWRNDGLLKFVNSRHYHCGVIRHPRMEDFLRHQRDIKPRRHALPQQRLHLLPQEHEVGKTVNLDTSLDSLLSRLSECDSISVELSSQGKQGQLQISIPLESIPEFIKTLRSD
ncbi:antA/AntB antirepressor family protein [Geoalkalibacter subterraneus]|uniref:antA/AntB antirepressor family protein n=1 Tax=Geoalkalibacter subterraneus TaxID=483547 RepID=UPI000693AA2B|nr:antA/AntB antirepressor family protein [Geoalkalibacter subterraneus]